MGQFIIDILNSIIVGLGSTATAIFSLLPDSPFQMLTNTMIVDYLPFLNWLIPINTILAEIQLLIPCFVAWYTWAVILRWLKVTQ